LSFFHGRCGAPV